MIRYGLVVLLLAVAGIATAFDARAGSDRPADHARPGQAATRGTGPPSSRPPRIVNRVLDLLDGEIALDAATDRTTWQSEPFDTAQFNRVGIRVVTADDSDPVICSLWWQFARDETFLPGPPSAGPQLIGDDSRLYPVSPISFSQVFGLRARAVCQLFSLPDFGRPEPPPPPSAVVSDVKVLLRLE